MRAFSCYLPVKQGNSELQGPPQQEQDGKWCFVAKGQDFGEQYIDSIY